MKVHVNALCRKLLCLLPHHGDLGSLLYPGHCLMRQYSCSKSDLVTAADLAGYWQDVFEANEIPEAQASSEYIVAHVLGAKTFQSLSATSILTALSAKQREQVQQLCAKRLQRMPVQYVLGEWDFQDLTLKMKPPVFIPRPETEGPPPASYGMQVNLDLHGLVQRRPRVAVLHIDEEVNCFHAELVSLVVDVYKKKLSSVCYKDIRQPPGPLGPVILEIGCGSGAIVLSLLRKLPQSQGIAIDRLEAAVNLTKENAKRLQLQKRVKILHQDIFSSSWERLLSWGLVDAIVSNPPYIFHEDMSHLAAEILCHEDLGALDGGSDGMNVIKEILNVSSYILKDLGSVFLEVDPRHPEMVKSWLQSRPELSLFVSAIHKDFCGKFGFFGDNRQDLFDQFSFPGKASRNNVVFAKVPGGGTVILSAAVKGLVTWAAYERQTTLKGL